jgi:isocitrate dehydrogenase
MKEAGAQLEIDEIKIGEKAYLSGHTSGISPEDWEVIAKNEVLFKAPITTPQGGGYKSLNVSIRKTLGLFANVRPVKALSPFVPTNHPKMDTVIIRENEEDLYAGIEHRQTEEVFQCLKLITKPGSEKIIRYAFEFAENNGRKKVTCMIKDNIMKLTDGVFHDTFKRIAKDYPEIETEHYIIDIGMARFANNPEIFDVIVLPNLYGDILSDVAAEIMGSVGLAGSSNIGEKCSMFEAIHGSAPDITGKDIANPTGILKGGLLMLSHLGQGKVAEKIENAWLKTIEDGIHTPDIYSEKNSKQKVGTKEFADAIIARLGQNPEKFPVVKVPQESKPIKIELSETKTSKKVLDGIDIFIGENNRKAEDLAKVLMEACKNTPLDLIMITNRGVKVWPDGNPLTFCTDHWRCRFQPKIDCYISPKDLVSLQSYICDKGKEIIKTENLYSFDGEKGYSLGQGQ